MTYVQTRLTTVREWQRKGFELTSQSNSKDSLLSLMAKAFETMADLLSDGSNRDYIHCSLLTLDSQRSIAMRFENTNSDAVRNLSYGIIQCLQLTLLDLIEKNSCSLKDNAPIPTTTTVDQYTQTEIVEDDLSVSNDNPSTSNSAEGEDLTLPIFSLVVPKREEFDNNVPNFHNNEINSLLLDNTTIKEEEMFDSNMTTYSANELTYCDAIDGEGLADRDMEEDEEIDYSVPSTSQPSAMKRMCSRENDDSVKNKKPSDTELICPAPGCEYTTRTTTTWLKHLRSEHKKTPHLLTPQCFFTDCTKYPNSLESYAKHLSTHDQTLIKAGYFLRCECGVQIQSRNAAKGHAQKCLMRNFSVHMQAEQYLNV